MDCPPKDLAVLVRPKPLGRNHPALGILPLALAGAQEKVGCLAAFSSGKYYHDALGGPTTDGAIPRDKVADGQTDLVPHHPPSRKRTNRFSVASETEAGG
jgi:hypothetical protein